VGSAESFGELAGALDYPMYVVTAAADGERAGCLVGFTTQCSISPARFLVCLSHQNHTYRVASRSPMLAVHVADERHAELARLFGSETGDDIDKFARCRWEPGPDGTPLLVDLPARFVGRVIDRVELGDHLGFVLDLVDADAVPDLRPLTFQHIRQLDPGHPA
jgi:flavin reductase (DIM6/NTAB) family NADH-FMN oxidoreductase RutF